MKDSLKLHENRKINKNYRFLAWTKEEFLQHLERKTVY